MNITRAVVVAVAALLITAQGAVAQDWPRKRERDRPQQQPQQQVAPGGGGACSPSGFARLSRNCSINTGGCQRMPESCNRGWCCP
jgi:hypothetical protein